MIDERLETQASLYALGALPPDESPAFEQELRSNPELQLLVAELREAANAVLLASPTVEPPAHLKQKILARLESGPAESRSKVVRLEQPSRPPALAWLPWALAACLAVVCGISIFQQSQTRKALLDLQSLISGLNQQVNDSNRQAAALRADLLELTGRNQQAQTQIAALTNRLQALQSQSADLAAANRSALERLARLTETNLAVMDQVANLTLSNRMALALAVELAGTNAALQQQLADARKLSQLRLATITATNAEAAVVWNNKDQKGVLWAFKLPPLPQGRDYQLWVIDDKKGPVSAGVIRLDAAGTATYAFNTVSAIDVPKAFAISLELKGGSPTPTDVKFVSN